jgi:Mn-dependent DtxR family transcriptional regulator
MEKSQEPDWLTEMDKEILEVMSSELILTPAIIAENIGRSRKGVSNRINPLQAGGLIEKIDRGKYRITTEGMDVWDTIETIGSGSRRMQVAENKLTERNLGVSKREYHEKIREEYNRIQKEEEQFGEPYREAIDRVEERLREQHKTEPNN